MSKDRKLLAELIRRWAQTHTIEYTISDPNVTDDDLEATSINFGWVVRELELNIDLSSLLDAIEEYVDDIRQHRKLDGMFCCKCGQFYDFAEANQDDGSMICYACRQNPYK